MKNLGAFLVGAALIFSASAQAQIQPGNGGGGGGGGGGSIVAPLTPNDLIAATSSTQAGDASTLTGPATLPVNLNLTGNLTLSGAQAATQAQQWSNITVGGTSTDTTGYQGYWQLHATDSAAAAGNAPLNGLTVRLQLTGTQGLRNAIDGYVSIDAMPSSSDASLQNYVGVIGQGYSDVSAKTGLVGGANYSGYAGSLWGLVGTPFLGTSDQSKNAVHWLAEYGLEADMGNVFAGSDVAERYGAFIVGKGSTLGAISDAGVDLTGTMGNGIQFGGVRQAFSATAFITSVNQTQGGTSNATATNGIDFSTATLTTFLKGPGSYSVDASGNTSGTTYKFNGTTTTQSGNEIFEKAANTINFAVNGVEIANYSPNAGSFFGNQNGATIFVNANTSAGASAQIEHNFQNSTSATEAELILNGGSFSGGLGANAFAIVGKGGIWLQGGSTPTTGLNVTTGGVVQLPNVTTGTPAASLCIDASNNIIKKTTTGSCV